MLLKEFIRHMPVRIPGKTSQALLLTIYVVILNWTDSINSFASLVSVDL